MRTRSMYRGIALLVVALTAVACQSEKIQMTIRATQGMASQTRTIYEDKLGGGTAGSVVVKWEGGSQVGAPVERIKVLAFEQNGFSDAGNLTSDPASISTDGLSITFDGSVTPATDYLAIYPADNCKVENDGSLSFNFLNQTQDCSAGNEMTHLKKYDIMSGHPVTGSTKDFTFKHEATMLRFDLTLPQKESINKITLTSGNENDLSTGMYAINTGSTNFMFIGNYGVYSINLAITNHTASTTLKAYMMTAPCDLSSDVLAITVTTASGNTYEGTLTTDPDTYLEAGLCYTLKPTLTLSKVVTVPTVSEGKLQEELNKITSLDPTQTDLEIAGKANETDIAALATFLKDSKAENITTLDLSELTVSNNAEKEVKGFANCTKIEKVILPNDAEVIGDNAFESCSALTTVTQNEVIPVTRASIPKGMKKIGASAFKNCTSITEMFLHGNITKIGNNAFAGCSAMTALVFEGTNETGTATGNIELGTGIITGTHAELKVFLPAIKDLTVATTYKSTLGKPTFYTFKNDYNNASDADKVNPTLYTMIPDGSSVPGFTPGDGFEVIPPQQQ